MKLWPMRHALMAKGYKSMQSTPAPSRERGLATASAMPLVNLYFPFRSPTSGAIRGRGRSLGCRKDMGLMMSSVIELGSNSISLADDFTRA